MGNRKQPFGYKMEFGEIVPDPLEAAAVRLTYLRCLGKCSFEKIAEVIQEQGVSYEGDKPWNKNMVARILRDQRYIDTEHFPPIITEELFNAVQERLKQLQPEKKQTEARKELRKICGKVPPEAIQRRVLHVLNALIENPRRIENAYPAALEPSELTRQRQELDELLTLCNRDTAKMSLLMWASHELLRIGPEEFETVRLRRLFGSARTMSELDAELLRQSVRMITYNRKEVKILLKNNQWIGDESV